MSRRVRDRRLAWHKRCHFHFTPTSASWMYQTETWFGILTRQILRRGSCDGLRALIETIDAFTSEWNDRAAPFVSVKTADQILAKAIRKTQETSGA